MAPFFLLFLSEIKLIHIHHRMVSSLLKLPSSSCYTHGFISVLILLKSLGANDICRPSWDALNCLTCGFWLQGTLPRHSAEEPALFSTTWK